MQLVVLAGLAFTIAGGPRRPAADIVVLNDGNRLEGIVTTSTLVPDVILFSDHVNNMLRIPRSKVQEIIRENEPASRLRIARAFAREGKYEQALDQVRQARRLAPTDATLQEEEQNLLRATAIRSAKQAEAKADRFRDTLNRVQQGMEAGQFDKALPLFATLEDETVSADIRDEAARLKIRFYERWGDYQLDKTDTYGAIECYEKVMDLDPNAGEVYQKLMRLYERFAQPGANMSRVQKLQDYLQAKVTEDPKDMDAQMRLANLLYSKKDWDAALQHYLLVYRDSPSSRPRGASQTRVEIRLRALLDGRQRKSAERREYDLAIEQFREYQSLFPDVDTQPLVLYQYQKRADQLSPQDDTARLDLVRYCEQYGLDNYARKELVTVLRNSAQNPEALRILQTWARADLAEIETAFNTHLFAQIAALVSQFHEKYPPTRYPSLQSLNDMADDYVEKARNELRVTVRDQRQRATELIQMGDDSFERGMTALYNYRDSAGTTYTGDPSGRRLTERVKVSAGSYRTDAIMYFERALRYYREALALGSSLTASAKQDVNQKISDCQRYLSFLKTPRNYRLPPGGPRQARRTSPQYPAPSGSNPYLYPYPYGYPYVVPINPMAPYGANPYYPGTPVWPIPPPSH